MKFPIKLLRCLFIIYFALEFILVNRTFSLAYLLIDIDQFSANCSGFEEISKFKMVDVSNNDVTDGMLSCKTKHFRYTPSNSEDHSFHTFLFIKWKRKELSILGQGSQT